MRFEKVPSICAHCRHGVFPLPGAKWPTLIKKGICSLLDVPKWPTDGGRCKAYKCEAGSRRG